MSAKTCGGGAPGIAGAFMVEINARDVALHDCGECDIKALERK